MPLKFVRKQGQKPFFPDYSLFTAAEACIPKALRAVLSAAAADCLKRPGEAMSLPGLFTPVAARCPQAPLRIWTIKKRDRSPSAAQRPEAANWVCTGCWTCQQLWMLFSKFFKFYQKICLTRCLCKFFPVARKAFLFSLEGVLFSFILSFFSSW